MSRRISLCSGRSRKMRQLVRERRVWHIGLTDNLGVRNYEARLNVTADHVLPRTVRKMPVGDHIHPCLGPPERRNHSFPGHCIVYVSAHHLFRISQRTVPFLQRPHQTPLLGLHNA